MLELIFFSFGYKCQLLLLLETYSVASVFPRMSVWGWMPSLTLRIATPQHGICPDKRFTTHLFVAKSGGYSAAFVLPHLSTVFNIDNFSTILVTLCFLGFCNSSSQVFLLFLWPFIASLGSSTGLWSNGVPQGSILSTFSLCNPSLSHLSPSSSSSRQCRLGFRMMRTLLLSAINWHL